MKCYICGAPAEQAANGSTDAVLVRCPKCGEYEVSPQAKARLTALSPYARLQALRYAQTNAQPGRRPHLHGIA